MLMRNLDRQTIVRLKVDVIEAGFPVASKEILSSQILANHVDGPVIALARAVPRILNWL